MPLRPHVRLRRAALSVAAVALVLPVAACAGSDSSTGVTSKSKDEPTAKAAPTSKAQVTANINDAATGVAVDRLVQVDATDGTLSAVKVATLKGQVLTGALNQDRTAWVADQRLEPGKKYQITATAADSDGVAKSFTSRFDSQVLRVSDQQVYASVTPRPNDTVGVGMPIMVKFDIPIKNKKLYEQHMKVTSSAGQTGSWFWMDDENAHFRPASYWKPHQKVSVDLDLNSLPAGNGVFGQEQRKYSFEVARSMVSKVNIQTHQMQVYRDGKRVNTIPITTGKANFTTRSGTKVIMEKYRSKRMNSETIGINPDSADGYNLDNVEYAMRVTSTGEFLHAAPWSVGSQGRANVSHGCTGMSTSNARWMYDNSIVGDVVEYTGSTKYMTLTNGYGDWNDSWAQWQKGSALT